MNQISDQKQNIKIKELNQNFDNFSVSFNNRLPFAACKAISESPSDIYNPLFISGPKGSGKTHLLKAIEEYTKFNHPNLTVKYYEMSFFIDLFIHIENEDMLNIFRKETRDGDVFLFDNIDSLEKSEVSNEEFFHTFNDIYQKGSQIVITSKLNTKELMNFHPRLISRLEWGLSTTILPHNYETKLLIIEKFFEINNIKANIEIRNLIVNSFDDNIRDIINFLKRLSYSFIVSNQKSLEYSFVEKNLKDENPKPIKTIDSHLIQDTVSKFLNVNPVEMLSKSRMANIVEARHIAIYLMRNLTNHTLKEIGILFGRRHHTTIMHAEEEILKKIHSNDEFKNLINKIKEQIEKN